MSFSERGGRSHTIFFLHGTKFGPAPMLTVILYLYALPVTCANSQRHTAVEGNSALPAARALSVLVVWQGWEAVGRLRMSSGLDVERYAGSFFRRTASDMDFPALSSDHSFAIQLRHDGSLNTGRPVLLQYALVYSTASGHRRIRCACPLALAACSTITSRIGPSPAPCLCTSHPHGHRCSCQREQPMSQKRCPGC